MSTLYALYRPLLFKLPPEYAHGFVLQMLRFGAHILPAAAPDDPILHMDVLGHAFTNPFGMAAGFDKNAIAMRGIDRLGFGFGEVGTVTPEPQFGNLRPRLFRIVEAQALINRLGFNNQGQCAAAMRLAEWRQKPQRAIIGVNIGANRDSLDKVDDYVCGAMRFALLADYLVLNISSPNTPGLRDLQGDILPDLIDAVRAQIRQVPLLIKLAPDIDISQMEAIAETILAKSVDGLIIGNSTTSRPPIDGAENFAHYHEAGGLSGAPLGALALQVLQNMRRLTAGRCILIAAGGIMDAHDAYMRIRAGASLLQLYTTLIYHGAGFIGRAKRELAAYLRRDGFAHLSDAVGVDIDK